jgi:hypothetical protein
MRWPLSGRVFFCGARRTGLRARRWCGRSSGLLAAVDRELLGHYAALRDPDGHISVFSADISED